MQTENFGGRSARAVGLEIADRLNRRWGVRLDAIAENHALTVAEKRRLMTEALLDAIYADLDAHNRNAGIPVDEADLRGAREMIGDTDVELEPNITFTEHNYKIIRSYRGDDVYNFLFTLTKRFENMAAAKTEGQLAIEIVSSSLVSVGLAMAKLTITAWRGGATLLAAVRAGVTGVGLKTGLAVVAIVLIALLLYLILDNPKKILGLVINDTDDDFIVKDWRKGVNGAKDGDLFMAHGHVESFPEDHETGDLDSPLVQLRKRFWFRPGDEENTVCGAVYFADRNVGFRGAEGVMIFTSKQNGTRLAHQFAVPYTNDNGVNIALLDGTQPADIEELFRALYNERGTAVEKTAGGLSLTAVCNSARGGVVGAIATMSKV